MSNKPFINEDFLLDTEEAHTLYHKYAKDLPIIDYHSHLDPKLVAENKRYDNIAPLWLAGDHYKWRAMRTNGVPEEYCSGQASDREKYDQWAAVVPKLLRNPLYHWTHLELNRPFGINDVLLSPETAEEIWQRTSEFLSKETSSVCGIMEQMNVEVVCTTDDPLDDLASHKAFATQGTAFRMLPTFRPDKARMTTNLETWNAWVDKLETLVDMDIMTLGDFVRALQMRHDYFASVGCKLSDNGVDFMGDTVPTVDEAKSTFVKLRACQEVSWEEKCRFSNYMLTQFARMDAEAGWVMQLHIGALRNPNSRALKELGVDTGYDAINDITVAQPLSLILDRIETEGGLPKTILYNLNPKDNAILAVMAGSFQDGITAGKIQFGAAWWFMDQLEGMTNHIESLSQLGTLSRFVGMLTDSRSFLSYTRHEYFRRLLCRILGKDMKEGLIPYDWDLVGTMVSDICYYNAKNYFNF